MVSGFYLYDVLVRNMIANYVCAVLSDDESVDLSKDALVLVLHEVEVAPDVGQVPADLGHAAAHLLEDGSEGRVDVHQDLQVVSKVTPSPARKDEL